MVRLTLAARRRLRFLKNGQMGTRISKRLQRTQSMSLMPSLPPMCGLWCTAWIADTGLNRKHLYKDTANCRGGIRAAGGGARTETGAREVLNDENQNH